MEDLTQEEQERLFLAMRDVEGGPLELLLIVGSPITAALMGGLMQRLGLNVAVGAALGFVGSIIAGIIPFMVRAAKMRATRESFCLSRKEMRRARKLSRKRG